MYGLTKESEGVFKGYVTSLPAFFALLNADGQSFSIRSSHAPKNSAILFRQRNVSFNGNPFVILKTTFYECALGKKYYGSRKESLSEDHPGKRRRFALRNSKKVGCSAHMKVQKILFYEKHKLQDYSLWREKKKILSALKNEISQGNAVTKIKYLISLVNTHNHSEVATQLNQRIDSRLKAEIKRVIFEEGSTSIHLIKFALKQLRTALGIASLSTSNKAFFPSDRIIRNYILKYTFEKRKTKIGEYLVENCPTLVVDQQVDTTVNETVDSVNNCNNGEVDTSILERIREVAKNIIDMSYSSNPNVILELEQCLKALQEAKSFITKTLSYDEGTGIVLLPCNKKTKNGR